MKTIEERANKFALEKHPYSPFREEYEKMYIEIATEQKAIDDADLKETQRQRDEYFDELVKLRTERAEWIEKEKSFDNEIEMAYEDGRKTAYAEYVDNGQTGCKLCQGALIEKACGFLEKYNEATLFASSGIWAIDIDLFKKVMSE